MSDAAAAGGGFDKLVGKSTGHYHLSFPDYIQSYDGITTASVEWKEDPTYDPGCHCRTFFATQPLDSNGNPTGGIDWTWDYVVEYGDNDQCSDHVGGHLGVGQGVSDPSEQMLVLWEDPNDPDQYAYSASGGVTGEASLHCDGGFTMPITPFLSIPGPDLINTTTPSPFAQAQTQASSASMPSCDSTFRVPRDASRIQGSCYEGNVEVPFDPYDYNNKHQIMRFRVVDHSSICSWGLNNTGGRARLNIRHVESARTWRLLRWYRRKQRSEQVAMPGRYPRIRSWEADIPADGGLPERAGARQRHLFQLGLAEGSATVAG